MRRTSRQPSPRPALSTTCLRFGALEPGAVSHPDGCPVTAEGPVVCPCVCAGCRRAWFGAGGPVVKDGRVVKTSMSGGRT